MVHFQKESFSEKKAFKILKSRYIWDDLKGNFEKETGYLGSTPNGGFPTMGNVIEICRSLKRQCHEIFDSP